MLEELDETDLMLLQHPEMWGNDYSNAYEDIISYGRNHKEKNVNQVIFDLHYLIVVKPNKNKRLY